MGLGGFGGSGGQFGNSQGLGNNPSNSWGLGGEQGWNNGGMSSLSSGGGQARTGDPFSRGMGGLMMNTQPAPANDFDLLASQYTPSNQMGLSSMNSSKQSGQGMDLGFDLSQGTSGGNKPPIFNNPNLQFKNQQNNKKPNNLDFDLL